MAWWKMGVFFSFVAAAVLRRITRYKRLCPSQANLNGKTVLITGANSGIGRATAIELARRKAKVILACRSILSAKETEQHIKRMTGNSMVISKELNLASLNSIKQFCTQILEEEQKIDILINNAGVFQCPYTKTEDGFEMQMGVNHFGHFLLTSLLLDKIKSSSPSRIVIVSSALSKRGSIKFEDVHSELHYSKTQAYADSKLANLLFARELSQRLQGTGVDVLSLHPGMVVTNLGRHVMPKYLVNIIGPVAVFLGLRDASEGCQSVVYCAVADELQGKSGMYIGKDCKECQYPVNALDDEAAKQLWSLSEKLTKPYL
ncbi:retinol dehydrogenase 14-like [Physella acuta]|uniref:retinol dehydrogenase 14-like n=1 Tax=Physella acuta TaxID=109671 RepID=UPI0027DDDD5F|nr:retinol dehydrogenase 14-like [Physella acuta]XP_059148049.1 retinol dehydrogenase 14-like [Physella acuta]